jgi:hypothetical protein
MTAAGAEDVSDFVPTRSIARRQPARTDSNCVNSALLVPSSVVREIEVVRMYAVTGRQQPAGKARAMKRAYTSRMSGTEHMGRA